MTLTAGKFQTKFPEHYDFYRINFDNPKRNLRDDIKLIPLALELGWDVTEGDTFGDTNIFTKGNRVVWYCRKGWACADIIDGMHTDHRYYPELKDALEWESKNET